MEKVSVAGGASASFKGLANSRTGTANPINEEHLVVRVYHSEWRRVLELNCVEPFHGLLVSSNDWGQLESPQVIVTEGKGRLLLFHLRGFGTAGSVHILPQSPFSMGERVENSVRTGTFLPSANLNKPSLDAAFVDIECTVDSVPCSDEVKEFAAGFGRNKPTDSTVRMANRVFREATKLAVEYDFYVDDSDGAFGVMLRLQNGVLLLAELSVDGILSGGTYNEEEGSQIEFLSNATVEQMVNLF